MSCLHILIFAVTGHNTISIDFLEYFSFHGFISWTEISSDFKTTYSLSLINVIKFTVCHVIADELQWEINQVDPRKMLEVIKTVVLIEK